MLNVWPIYLHLGSFGGNPDNELRWAMQHPAKKMGSFGGKRTVGKYTVPSEHLGMHLR